MKQVHLRVDDELYNELNAYSAMTEQTMQDCVREAVAYYVTDMRRKQMDVKDRQFTFIDLFAGIGGMRIAFERAGGHCVYSNEWNKYSQQTYFASFYPHCYNSHCSHHCGNRSILQLWFQIEYGLLLHCCSDLLRHTLVFPRSP